MRLYKQGIIRGITGCFLLTVLILIGSRRLHHFDAALVPYLFGTLFAVFGIIYRYAVWLSRPPTQTLWKRSLKFFFSPQFFTTSAVIIKNVFQNIAAQKFIGHRSPYRWIMHFMIAWGCLLAFAVTFPLVFGWLHFETPVGQEHMYQIFFFGFPTMVFDPYGLMGFFIFNALNFCSVMIIIGTVMAFTRRFLLPGEITTQTFAGDLLPLLILFSVAITGLFMTYDTHFLAGRHYRVLSTIHCWTVVMFLIYLPFGKFFHIFQRFAQMGAGLYIRERMKGHDMALCPKTNQPFTSRMQKEDVKHVLKDLGFEFDNGIDEYSIQDLSPESRRKLLMTVQNKKLKGKFNLEL